MYRVVLLAAFCVSVSSSEILFSDDFSDGNADGWTEYGSCSCEVIAGQYCFYGGLDDNGLSISGDSSGVMTVPDYSLRASVLPEICTMAGLISRYATDGYIYMLVLYPSSNMLLMYEIDDNSQTNMLDYCSYSIQEDQVHWLRLEVDGYEIKGKVWTGTPEDEPMAFQLTAVSAGQPHAGSVGLFCVRYSTDADLSVYFDDVEVTDELSSALGAMSWGMIKAAF